MNEFLKQHEAFMLRLEQMIFRNVVIFAVKIACYS